MENFGSYYSNYYDLLYKDKNYKAESDYVINLIRSINSNAKDVLELGSGTGNHAALFCQQRFQVTGLERSAEMVSRAQEKSIDGFTSIVSDISTFEIPQQFDAAISLFHVISYLTGNGELISCFNTVNKHLKADGIFIFDVWYSPAVYSQRPVSRIKKLEDETFQVIRTAEPQVHVNSNIVDVNYQIIIQNKVSLETERYEETHPMRHFSIPEIELAATLSNFQIIKAEEFLTGNMPGTDTWGVCFILKKNIS